MAQVIEKRFSRMSVFVVLYLAFPLLMFHQSLLFLYIYFKITSVDTDTMLIDDPDLDEIADFSKNACENIGLFGVLTVFESSVSNVFHDDFALQRESKQSMHRETDCKTERESERERERKENVL